jgi:phage terminase Nu1 subunit (DNA packaging protein)
MGKSKHIDTKQAIRMFKVTRDTLFKWRQKGCPYYTTADRFISYKPEEVKRWLKERYTPKSASSDS